MRARRRDRRRRWPAIVAALVLLVVVYAGVSALRLVHVDHELRAGVAQVSGLKGHLHGDDLTSGRVQAQVTAAAADFGRAASTMGSPWWDPLEVVPVAGRQLASVRALSTAASTTASAGGAALAEVRTELAAPHATPAQRTAVLGALASVTGTLHQRLASVQLGPRTDLLHPLATERDTFTADLAQVDTGLSRTAAAAQAMATLFRGPSTYLVLAGNNAEMRDGSGMFLQAGSVSFDAGSAKAGSFTDTSTLSGDQPAVPITGDLEARWGYLRPGQEWRNLALSPQFPLNAPVAAAMWAARGNRHVDGVLALDVGALSDLLGATGPVTVGGTTYAQSTVVQQLLVTQYDGLTGADVAANSNRQSALGTLAAATLTSLERSASIGQLVDALAAAADGRHLMVWSSDPATESAWSAAGVSGTVPADGLLLGLLNEGADKLDPFEQVHADLQAVRSGPDTDVTVTVTVRNPAPTYLSPYAGDGEPGPRLAYNGALSLDLPSYAGHITATGAGGYQTAGADGATDQVAVAVAPLLDGASRTVTYRFELAGDHGELLVQPSARLPATTWTASVPGAAVATFDDSVPKALQW